jgi:hypothetical protein
MEAYKSLHSEQVLPTLNKSIQALFKGDEQSNLDEDLGE